MPGFSEQVPVPAEELDANGELMIDLDAAARELKEKELQKGREGNFSPELQLTAEAAAAILEEKEKNRNEAAKALEELERSDGMAA